jgi:hypothetical protein
MLHRQKLLIPELHVTRGIAPPLLRWRAAFRLLPVSGHQIKILTELESGNGKEKVSREFKLEAVRLVKDRVVSVAQAVRNLENMLGSTATLRPLPAGWVGRLSTRAGRSTDTAPEHRADELYRCGRCS